MKIAIGIIVAIVVLAGGWYFVSQRMNALDPNAAMVTVRTEPVGRGDLVEIVSAPGQVQPKTKVQISARVAARIVELPFDEGATVTKSSVLVKLDATEMDAQLRATEARAAGQKAQLEESTARVQATASDIDASNIMLADSKRDLDRQKQLLASSDVSQSIVDSAQSKFDQLQQQLESSRHQLEADKLNLKVLSHAIEAAEAEILRAKDNLNYTTILSPIDGIITRLNAKAGEMVVTGTMNNPGTVIMEVSDLSEMQVDAQIDESNVAMVKEDQPAKVRITAYPDDIFDGTVKLVGLDTAVDQRQSSMSSSSSMQGKWYKARIVLDTAGKRIPAGLTADVDIETKHHRKVIKVPTQCVMGRSPDQIPEAMKKRPEVDLNKTLITVVFVAKDNKAVLTPVAIGAGDMTHTIITSGLNEGDQIISGPYKVLPDLKDGQTLKVENPASTSQPTTQPATATTSK